MKAEAWAVQAHSLKFHFAFLCVLLAASCALAEIVPTVSVTSGGWTYQWDPDAIARADPPLATSIPGTFDGADIASIIGADTFYDAGIMGQNTISTSIEGGHIWNGHQALTHVTSFNNHVSAPTQPFVTPAFDVHATLVGMAIGGRDVAGSARSYRTGVAPQTDLRSGAFATHWAGPAGTGTFFSNVTTVDFPFSSPVSGFGTADVINSSWGANGSGDGSLERQGRDFRSMITDSLANENRFSTFVVSAGNEGNSIGTNSVRAPGAGYNGITVGALQNDGANNYIYLADFSSHGPQAYGDPVNGLIPAAVARRAAVDIAAPGTGLTSAFYGGQSGENDPSLADSSASGGPNFYSPGFGGTSAAAPVTAGGVSLMKSAAKANSLPIDALDTRVIKANLLNAASKIPEWTNGQVAHPNGNEGVLTTQALDFNSGAGALNLEQTYKQYLLGQTDIAGLNGGSTSQTTGWDYANVSLNGVTDVVIDQFMDAGSTFNATLSWFRERTYTSATSQNEVAFADLNLEIWDSAFTTLYSESKSTYTPIEHLSFDLPVTGKYGIRVSYPQNLFGRTTSVPFGLAWSDDVADDLGVNPPTAVANFDLTSGGMDMATFWLLPGEVAFAKVAWGGGEMTATTNFPETTLLGEFDFFAPDTELFLFDELGALISSNDDEDLGSGILTSLLVEDLPAGTYYIGIGGYNTFAGAGFDLTSTNPNSGFIKLAVSSQLVPEPSTFALGGLACLGALGYMRRR